MLRGSGRVPRLLERPRGDGATLVDGWLHTGDLARRDAEGYFSIVDRKKDLIITGGLNVYPAEVESVLYGIDGVREVAVVGAPHERWGEEVVAVIAGSKEPGAELERRRAGRRAPATSRPTRCPSG